MSLPIDVLIKMRAETPGLSTLESAIDRFGMRLRLTGRDLMRLGGVTERFFDNLNRRIVGFLRLGEVFSGAWEDVQLAIGDVADAIAIGMEPLLEILVDWLERLADFLETQPWIGLATAIALVSFAVGKLIGKLLVFKGYMSLTVGALITAKKSGLSFTQVLEYLVIRLKEGEEAAKAYLASIKGAGGPLGILIENKKRMLNQIATEIEKLRANRASLIRMRNEYARTGLTTKEAQAAYAEINKMMDQNYKMLVRQRLKYVMVSDEIKRLERRQKKSLTGLKKETSLRERLTRGIRKSSKGLLKFGAITSGIVTLGLLFFLNWEPLLDLFQTIGELVEDALTPFGDFIYYIIDLIEEHPDLAKLFLMLIMGAAGAFLIFKKLGIVTKIVSGLTSKFGGILGKVSSPMTGVKKNTLKTVLAISALIASLALLFYTLTQFFLALSKMGLGAGEILGVFGAILTGILGFVAGLGLVLRVFGSVSPTLMKGILAFSLMIGVISLLVVTITNLISVIGELEGGLGVLWNVVGAMIALTGAMMGIAFVAGMLAPILAPGIGILLGLGLAANLFAIALNLVALAASTLSNVFVTLLEYLKANYTALLPLVPLLFGLAGGLTAAGVAGLASFLGLSAAALGIGAVTLALTAFAGSIGLLAASLSALAAALAAIPDWARDLVGGILGGISGIIGGVAGIFKIPSLQRGGYITRAGIAYLHAGETVVPAGYTSSRSETINYITINISGEGLTPHEIAEEVSKILAERV